MKKIYIQPSIKAVTVKVEGMVCWSPERAATINKVAVNRNETLLKYGEQYEDEIDVAW